MISKLQMSLISFIITIVFIFIFSYFEHKKNESIKKGYVQLGNVVYSCEVSRYHKEINFPIFDK